MSWTIPAISYFYFLFVGTCYMLGYWTPLHFNILDYLSPIDIIKSATYPVIPALVGTVAYVLIDTINTQPRQKIEGDKSKVTRALNYIAMGFIATLIIVNAINLASYIYMTFTSEPEKRFAFALPALSLVSTIYLLVKPPFLIEHSRYIRHFVIIFMCALPTISYYQGDKDLSNSLNGKTGFHYLKEPTQNCKIGGDKLIYIGFYGSTWFFVNSSNKDLCLEKDGGIMLGYYTKHDQNHEDPNK